MTKPDALSGVLLVNDKISKSVLVDVTGGESAVGALFRVIGDAKTSAEICEHENVAAREGGEVWRAISVEIASDDIRVLALGALTEW